MCPIAIHRVKAIIPMSSLRQGSTASIARRSLHLFAPQSHRCIPSRVLVSIVLSGSKTMFVTHLPPTLYLIIFTAPPANF
jgi:hypothetical protein